MKNKKCIYQVLIYLLNPEDSSEPMNLAGSRGNPQIWHSAPSWLGIIKTILWALVATALPLVLAALSFWVQKVSITI